MEANNYDLMETTKDRICRLCLTTCKDTFEVLNEIQCNLNFILLYLDLAITDEPEICVTCTESIKYCFDFKSKCIGTEDKIGVLASSESNVKVDLRDVYIREKANESIIDSEDYVCRLCLEIVKSGSFTLFENEDTETLRLYFPELDLNMVEQPVVCASCHISLQKYFTFIKNCLRTENEIMEYCKVEGRNIKGQIDLNNVARFMSKDKLKIENGLYDVDTEVMCVKKEGILLVSSEIKKENCIDIVVQELDIKMDVEEAKMEPIDYNGHTIMHTTSPAATIHEHTNQNYETKHEPNPSHKNADPVQMVQCYNCGYQTKNKYSLRRHMIIHGRTCELTMHKCTECSFQTKYKNCLSKHSLTHKSPDQLNFFRCHLCDYKSKIKFGLQRHMVVHKSKTEMAMHKCTVCGFETKRQLNLTRHMVVHKSVSEVSMHKCTECNFETKHKNYLGRHMLLHRSADEVIMYKCHLCDYQTKLKTEIHRHAIVHKSESEVTMHKCTVCSFETKHMSSIRRHMLIHKKSSEIVMHKCTKCNIQFKLKQYLRSHALTHEAVVNL